MSTPRLILRHLVFDGIRTAGPPVGIDFSEGSNLIYGASNTGKSYTLKSLNFMLGGKTALPTFREQEPYDDVLLGFSITGQGDFTLARAVAGARFVLFDGLLKTRPGIGVGRELARDHDGDNEDNLSTFFLQRLGFGAKRVAIKASGEQGNLSFRHIVQLLLADETSIQAENSPVIPNRTASPVNEQSVFKLLLTGADDSAIVAVPDRTTFRTSKAARLATYDEMIAEVDAQLLSDFPDPTGLAAQVESLGASLERMQAEFERAQGSVVALLHEKETLARQLPAARERLAEIQLHLGRFERLDAIYLSDVERLGSIEEAGFLLSLHRKKPCPLCGAPADAQHHGDDIPSVEDVQVAAAAEVKKIAQQRSDLAQTVTALRDERTRLEEKLPKLEQRLDKVEREITARTPHVKEQQTALHDVLAARDEAKRGLAMLGQKTALIQKRIEHEKKKAPGKKDRPQLKPPTNVTHDFAQAVSAVLEEWQFPGDRKVYFDEKTFDIVIDGKPRTTNGKGVRAVTHAAFKVALLMYCQQRGLPHPGLLVLDTPLLTYRDPLLPGSAPLGADEQAVAATPLKRRFFEHLASLGNSAQFVVLENIDPPIGIDRLAKVQRFTAKAGVGRPGLFPPRP